MILKLQVGHTSDFIDVFSGFGFHRITSLSQVVELVVKTIEVIGLIDTRIGVIDITNDFGISDVVSRNTGDRRVDVIGIDIGCRRVIGVDIGDVGDVIRCVIDRRRGGDCGCGLHLASVVIFYRYRR